jgi:hypothetical protein
VIMEGLPVGGHRLSLPPSSVRFGPHGSDKLPSKWDKLTQELGLGAGEQLDPAKGSVQLLAFARTALLSMVLTACGRPRCEVTESPGTFRVPLASAASSLAAATAPALSYRDQVWSNRRGAPGRRGELSI